MKCWNCGTELIWGGDHDVEDHEEFFMVSNLSCPKCNSYVEFYTARDVDDNHLDSFEMLTQREDDNERD